MNDWLGVETPEDWLSTEPVASVPTVLEKPRLTALPATPDSSGAKLELLQQCWDRLTTHQKFVIDAWRECRWNLRSCIRQLDSTPNRVQRGTVYRSWMSQDDFGFVVKVLRADAAGLTLDKDSLLLRQDDIVEQLMTPTPILHQGAATGYFENRAPAASKANETLMKAAGLLKNDDQTTRHVVRFVNLAGPEVQTAIEVATEIT